MRTFFTPLKTLLLILSLLLGSIQAQAQLFTDAQLEHNDRDRYTAITRDNAGNIYVVRPSGAAGTAYEVAKYTNGQGTPTVIFSGLTADPPNLSYPYGITVDGQGNVFVVDGNLTGALSQGQIWKLAPGGGGSYSANVFVHDNYYTAIAHDGQDNIYTMEYDATTSLYGVAKYTAGSTTRTMLWSGLTPVNPSNPWGLVVDDLSNIYFTTFLEGGGSYDVGGDIVKLAPPYNSPVKLQHGNGYTALALDGSNNLYTLEYDAGLTSYDVRKYTNPVTANAPGTVIYNNLILNAGDPFTYPLGLAVQDNGAIYTADVFEDNTNNIFRGQLHRLTAPTTTVSSITRIGTSPTNTSSPAYTVTFSSTATGANASNFTTTTTGTASVGSITVTPVNSTTYTVTANGVTGDGTLRLNMTNNNGMGYTVTNLPFTTGEVYTIDKTAPTASLNINSGAAYTQTTGVTLTASATDASTPLQMRFSPDNATWSAYEPFATTKAYTLPAGDGVKNVYMQVLDAAGNVATVSDDITLDATAPTFSFTATPAAITSSSTASFMFTASEPNCTFAVSLDGGPFVPATSPLTLTGLADGPHTLVGKATDPAGNTGNINTFNWTIDTHAPTLVSITPPADGYYRAGTNLSFTIQYSENVTVTGTPFLQLDLGGVTRNASYTGGSGTNTLTFQYAVVNGDADNDGIGITPAIQLNGGTIQDQVSLDAATAFTAPALTNVRVKTSIPTVSVTMADPSPVNHAFTVTFTFSDPVTGFDNSDLTTSALVITPVTSADGGIIWTATVTPSVQGAGSIVVPANVAVDLAGNGNQSGSLNFDYDNIAPALNGVTTPGGTYKAGNTITFTAAYSEPVTVTGTPYISLEIGATTRQAAYSGGSGTSTLTFSYTVVNGDLDLDGPTANPAGIQLNGGTIRDAAQNDGGLAFANTYSNVLIDAVAPTVTSVDVPATGYYKAGQALTFTAHMSENVTVTGTPSINIDLGGVTRQAMFTGGSGSNALTFTYTVAAGDNDADGITADGNLQLNGGTVQDGAGNDAALALNNMGSTNLVFVDTNAPGVTLTSATADPTNGNITVTATFTEAVNNLGAAGVAVTNGTVSVLSGSGTNWSFTVIPAADGNVSITLNAGAAQDNAGNDNTVSNILSYVYDHTAPVVSSVSVPANGYYQAGQALTFTVHFSENVTATGVPQLPITIGTTTVNAAYTGGTGSQDLTFTYTTVAGDNDRDGIALGSALVLNGGSIKDAAGNDATLTLNSVASTSMVFIITTPPTVTSVEVPADGSYNATRVLTFKVHFSDFVSVSGTPTLPVTIGTNTVNANYLSGTGSNILVFTYQVVTGDNDNDGIALGSALELNGGAILDIANNAADLRLNNVPSTTGVLVDAIAPTVTLTPAPTGPVNHSIALTATFSEPVTGFTTAGVTVTNGAVSSITGSGTTYTVNITPTADGNVTATVSAGAAEDAATNSNTVSNTLTYVYDGTAPAPPVITGVAGANPSNVAVNTIKGTAEANAMITLTQDGTAITPFSADALGNWSYTTGNLVSGTYNFTATATDAAGNTSGVSNLYALVVDYVTPTVMNVAVPTTGSYKAGSLLTFIVSFNKALNVTGTPQLPITIGSSNVNADYVSGSGTMYLTFRYTVVAGDNDNDGITVGSALALNGGTIIDAASNLADLMLHMVDPTNNVLVDTRVPDVTLAPNATGPVKTNININITFTEPANNFTAGGITVSNGAVLNFSGSGATYTATIAPAADGNVTMQVNAGVAQDAAGNDNNASNQLVYSYDHTAPAAPVIVAATGGNPSHTAINTLSGAAEPNSTVTLTQNGAVAGSVTANAGGNWSYTTAGLADGTYNFTANATDDAGNTSVASNPYSLVVDLTAPVVSSVAAPAAGSYKAGTTQTFTVHFSEPVTVTGQPQLAYTIGSSTVNAGYVSGSGSTDLVFTYTVVAGDNDNDGITLGTLSLNGGTITDNAGNNADLTLHGVGNTTQVLVDTQAPDVTLSTAAVSPVNHAFTITVAFTEPVNALSLNLHNATAGTVTTTDNKTFTVVIIPTADGTVTAQVDAGASQDAAGNNNTASNILTLVYDATAPTITAVGVPAPKTYVAAENLDFTVTFNSDVIITGAPTLNIVVGSSTRQAALQTSTASTATFRYTVQPGDADADGITLPAALSLNGGSIADAAGNPADPTLHGAGTTTGVKVDAVPPVITAAQSFTAITESPVGTSIGTLAGNDPGGNGTLQHWTLTGDDAAGVGLAAFQLNATTGVLSVKNTTVLNQHVNETITLQVTVSDGYNTSAVQTVAVLIKPKFLAPTDITLSNNAVNERAPLHTAVGTFTTVTAQPNVTFTYTFAGGADDAAFTISGDQLQTNTTLDYATRPVYHIRIRSTDSNAQFTEKDFTINVNFVNQPPVINTIPNQAVCATTTPQTVAVSGISAVEAGQTYTLAVSANRNYFDALTITDDGSGKATIHYTEKADVSGSVQVTVVVKDNGGQANGGKDTRSTSFAINIAAPPVVTITSDVGLSINKGDYVHLEANADQATSYSWIGTTEIISGQQTATIYVRPLSDATYTVTVTNDQGCSNTASVNLQVSPEAKQNAANILTPNGDGQNDHWIVKNIDLFPDNEVKIFDRSGRLVYTKKGYTNDWTGTVNGQPLAEGTYYYIIDYGNGQPVAKGYITIVRDKY
ncbi:hypothetical protein DCC81_19555 [Chitinophaga parva]|uniref:Cadherin domain-containing protein n=1 Tax=Chitinophaga parva TaxID=2169414 RepID=A0A2T7BC17_9BACT|nr:Ig-like domain-containing protein [Chitinophaga parva]PUZ22632.1 hypothetical protein DCC81_19555 [Chitinophaga parva]